jgi:hypothetical protein
MTSSLRLICKKHISSYIPIPLSTLLYTSYSRIKVFHFTIGCCRQSSLENSKIWGFIFPLACHLDRMNCDMDCDCTLSRYRCTQDVHIQAIGYEMWKIIEVLQYTCGQNSFIRSTVIKSFFGSFVRNIKSILIPSKIIYAKERVWTTLSAQPMNIGKFNNCVSSYDSSICDLHAMIDGHQIYRRCESAVGFARIRRV